MRISTIQERSLSGDHPMNEWEEVWRSRLAQTVQFIQFSPDGVYFATCGVEDKIVKVWYTDTPGEGFVASCDDND